MERPRHPSAEQIEADEFFRHPPVAILPFDCDIPGNDKKAKQIMLVRCALTAKILYDSSVYKTPQDRPFIVCFANAHKDGDVSGAQKIARILRSLGIPEEKIITRTTTITNTGTTITNTGDMSQLHALAKEMRLEGPLAVVTTNGHRRRARQEAINHQKVHKDFGPVYVIYPKHTLTNRLQIRSGPLPDPRVSRKIQKALATANTSELNHGLQEAGAWAFSAISLLRPLKQRAEEYSHEDMRHKEQSRYVAKKMKKAAKRLRTLRTYTKVMGLDPRLVKGLYIPKAER